MKIGIVGAGISGLATAQALRTRMPSAEVTVFEAAARPGGKVMTERMTAGYICEWGVNAFLDKSPPTLELCDKIGIDVLPADVSAKKRYVYSEGALHQLPEKPPQFFTSNLLSLTGRLRVIGEVFSGRAKKDDETLEEFGTRHLGREAFEKLIDPMASGVFAGDARTMSLKSCFPRIHEVEDEFGSLIRGLVSLQKKARKAGKKDKPGPGPGGILTSFENGMSVMTDALAALLGPSLKLDAPVTGLVHEGERYTVEWGAGERDEFEALVLACPAHVQAGLLAGLSPEFGRLVGEIPYPPLAVVCLGYERGAMGPGLDGFGFLVPSREDRGILGTVVDSNVFPNRAPEGRVLLRTLVGGARRPDNALLEDEPLLDRVRGELRDIMALHSDPEFASIYRHEKAIPQYLVGHSHRLGRLDKVLGRFPGLFLTGNAYRGVSLNDCVVNARKTADRVLPAV
ncbi:MAG: protoporphyrinogen oxidase [Gammaproteobacteria bacterium]|nr:protoporphyrinogen oxidase [Gammaproteobacteria bacterium]